MDLRSLANFLNKPAYVMRPRQVLTRLARPAHGETTVMLPWGLPLAVNAQEHMGKGIARAGVHELPITEVLWRLSRGDALAVDAGANSGYFTGLLALRAERVAAFEPHPVLHQRLAENIATWGTIGARINLHRAALSAASGTARLYLPDGFASNEGVATLEGAEAPAIDVRTVTLDEVIGDRTIGIMKIDVEGHELTALTGASNLLSRRRIRDIVFEEHLPLPSAVSTRLAGAGFTIFGVRESFKGVVLQEAAFSSSRARWHAPTYLATLNPDRAMRLTQARGWHALRPRSSL